MLNTALDLQQIRAARPKILNLLAVASDASANDTPSVSIWNAKEEIGGSTPLILAAIFGQPDIAKALIDAATSGWQKKLAKCSAVPPELLAGADTSKMNNDGLTPLGVVSGEWNAELQGIYQYVYGALNLTFDREHVRKTRDEISEMLRRHAAVEAGAQRQERQGANK